MKCYFIHVSWDKGGSCDSCHCNGKRLQLSKVLLREFTGTSREVESLKGRCLFLDSLMAVWNPRKATLVCFKSFINVPMRSQDTDAANSLWTLIPNRSQHGEVSCFIFQKTVSTATGESLKSKIDHISFLRDIVVYLVMLSTSYCMSNKDVKAHGLDDNLQCKYVQYVLLNHWLFTNKSPIQTLTIIWTPASLLWHPPCHILENIIILYHRSNLGYGQTSVLHRTFVSSSGRRCLCVRAFSGRWMEEQAYLWPSVHQWAS